MESRLVKVIPRQVKAAIEKLVVEENGRKFIKLGCYCMDFKHTYVFLGFTKNDSKVILGDIYMIGTNEVKYTKRFGKVETRIITKVDNTTVKQFQLSTDGYRYSETVLEIIQ